MITQIANFRYYLRTKAAADAIKFTVDQTMLKNKKSAKSEVDGPLTPEKTDKPQSTVRKAIIQQLLSTQGSQEECLNCGS